jgi:hypothetical protein
MPHEQKAANTSITEEQILIKAYKIYDNHYNYFSKNPKDLRFYKKEIQTDIDNMFFNKDPHQQATFNQVLKGLINYQEEQIAWDEYYAKGSFSIGKIIVPLTLVISTPFFFGNPILESSKPFLWATGLIVAAIIPYEEWKSRNEIWEAKKILSILKQIKI